MPHQPTGQVPRPTRHLTIQETASLYRLKYAAARSTPSIAPHGQWLTQAGFLAGHRVSVAVETGRLSITPEGDTTTH